ncbi:MAG: type IV-A pilus assembly ATPase PilB, partial [Janthinobacterium lividum]
MPLSGLARSLMQAGRLTVQEAETFTRKAQTDKLAFIDVLMTDSTLDSKSLAVFCSETFGYPIIDLAALNLGSLPDKVIDARLMFGQRVIALGKRGNKLTVAVSDPTNTQALEQIKFQTELGVEPVVVDHRSLLALLERLNQSTEKNLTELIGDDLDIIDFVDDDAGGNAASAAAADQASADVDDAPVVRFLQKILIDAINMGASDLHFEPFEKYYQIRFRVDGILREIAQPPLAIKEKLASRIKVISKLDISEKRVPQDGRMKLVLTKTRSIDFRVSTLPTLFGEKIVMRILDATQAQMGIESLGYDADQKETLMNAIQRPYGMVLVTGPTGSGKTVSLYTCLNILNKPGINISTAEDPAEINLPGVNQVNVNDRAGLTFPVALKAFLRQDPDIIMVGEIRDLETADIAIKAAQTGHMVFSTLHTNDAPATIMRLMNMGVAPFNIASAVVLITAQRLARRLCSCKEQVSIPDEALLEAGFLEDDLDGSWQPYKPVGCERCSGSGYKGRVGIYQIMPITEAIEQIILAHGT